MSSHGAADKAMNRFDLQRLAEMRSREAKLLLDANCFEGAFYLAGYAVECALKACIAKHTKQFDFPDKRLSGQIYKHDPKELLKTAGIETELRTNMNQNRELEGNWALVVTWSEESRYEVSKPEETARDFYAAITDSENGILPWLKKHW